MVQLFFTLQDGKELVVEAKAGHSAMEAAVRNDVPGIVAECGGACACATCHVYIDSAWIEKVGRATDAERMMLDFASGVQENSRLSCQIEISERLDGLRLEVAET